MSIHVLIESTTFLLEKNKFLVSIKIKICLVQNNTVTISDGLHCGGRREALHTRWVTTLSRPMSRATTVGRGGRGRRACHRRQVSKSRDEVRNFRLMNV